MLAFQGLFLDLFPESRHQEIWSGVVIEYETGQIHFKYQNHGTQWKDNSELISTPGPGLTPHESTWSLYLRYLPPTLGCRIPDQENLDKASFVRYSNLQFSECIKILPGQYDSFFSMLHGSFLLLIGGKHRKKWHLHLDKLVLIQGRLLSWRRYSRLAGVATL